jgi:hypothetical protein
MVLVLNLAPERIGFFQQSGVLVVLVLEDIAVG